MGSISEQVRALKLLLLGGAEKDSEAAAYFAKAAKGEVPLVVAASKVSLSVVISFYDSLYLTALLSRPTTSPASSK